MPEHPEIVIKIDTYLKSARSEAADWPVKQQPERFGRSDYHRSNTEAMPPNFRNRDRDSPAGNVTSKLSKLKTIVTSSSTFWVAIALIAPTSNG